MVDLPGVDRAATIVHTGPMDAVLPTVQKPLTGAIVAAAGARTPS